MVVQTPPMVVRRRARKGKRMRNEKFPLPK